MVDAATEQNILRLLHEQNPWWIKAKVPHDLAKPFRRRDFFNLVKKINNKNIAAIIGPRQVGKTTVIYQLIEYLIQELKVDPKRILYTSFDYPYLSTITQTPINDIFEVYSSFILREPLQKLNRPIYVFMDEICKLENWSEVLKGWFDLKFPIKFVISDSSTSDILKGSSESLVGRIELNVMLSLKFIDYLTYFEPDYDFNKINRYLRDGFQVAVTKNDIKALEKSMKKTLADLIPMEKTIKLYLQQYILKDGYPELLELSNLASIRQKMRDYLTLTIYKDLMRIFNIRDPKALEELITLVAAETSQRMEYSSLANTLSLKRDTVTKYLNYLEMVFLISRAEYYSKSRASRIKKSKKIYFNNSGLRNALVGMLNESLLTDHQELGKVVETLVHEHAKRLKFCLEPGIEPHLYYWKTQTGDEVDLIFEIKNKLIPIEVKYRDKIEDGDLKGLKAFFVKYKCPFGIIITKDLLELREKFVLIPLWLFLIMC